MGLNCSHNAFDGAYSAFNNLRKAVCFVVGGSYAPHYRYDPSGQPLYIDNRIQYLKGLDPDCFYLPDGMDEITHPGLWEFLTHSDCDGTISPAMCLLVANDLEAILPTLQHIPWTPTPHIERYGGYAATLAKFISGCREAHQKDESLIFG